MSKMELLKELEKSDEVCISAAIIAPILGTEPQAIRVAARTNPDALGFPVVCIKKRIMIPRLPFLAAMGIRS